jgi:hypothetical protein
MASFRTNSILAIVLLSILTAGSLYWARDTDQYVGNLMLNIGASFLGAIVTYALINPMMVRAENQAEKVLDRFNHGAVIQHINDASSTVRIFETGLALLDERYQRRFLAACLAALKGGVKIKILLLDPDCRAAEQRAEELRGSGTRIHELIRHNLRDFHKFHGELQENLQRRFEVRLYNTAPLAAYYRWDQRALISFFPTNRSSEFTTQYETSVDSSFAQFVEQRFDESWDAPSTFTLEQYFGLPIRIMKDSAEPEHGRAEWVLRSSTLYLANQALTDHAVATGLSNLRVGLLHVEPWVGAWALKPCDSNSPAHRYFEEKYGRRERTVLEVDTVLGVEGLPGLDAA